MSYSKAQSNFTESEVPEFKVPDPLTTFDGERIATAEEWNTKRRPELVAYFTDQIYGAIPEHTLRSSSTIIEQDNRALDGKAKRMQIQLSFTNGDKILDFTLLLYLPNKKNQPTVFLGYNFFGNHTISNDSAVVISKAWANNNEELGITDHILTENSRAGKASRWPLEKILDAGYGLATIYYGEVDPDKDDFSDGIHSLLYTQGQEKPRNDQWGSIAAWAWGMGRAMDYLKNYTDTKNSKVVALGHSRLGKAALWAGANDDRFAAVISNNSGCGGAALSKRKYGETIAAINQRFPHWFCTNFQQFNGNEEALQVDQHQLLALIAPRPLYVASAEEDQWADPKGEYLSAHYTTPVYGLFGKNGIPSPEMPKINAPIHNTVAYHIRNGKHDITDYDWEQYIKWANAHLH